MNRISLALLATAALAAGTIRAETRFSFGLHLGGPTYIPAPPPPVMVHTAPPIVMVSPRNGYWKEVLVKTWVPERWVLTRDPWGRSFRRCEPGHFTYVTDRVWVDERYACHPAPRYPAHAHGYRGR